VHIIPKNPTNILSRMNGALLIQPYFLINIQTKLDAVCVERSDVVVAEAGPFHFVNPRQITHLVKDVTLLKSVIAGNHLWQGRFHLAGYIFWPDALGERIQKLNWKNIGLEHAEEI
jgi:hypothetical protein